MEKIKVECRSISGNEQTLRTFVRMCAWMEFCGSWGHSVNFHVGFDGDGPARIEFDFGENQKDYEKLKKDIADKYNKTGKDIPCFDFC